MTSTNYLKDMNLNELAATVIDSNDIWHDGKGRPVGSLNDSIAVGLIESVSKFAIAIQRSEPTEVVERRAANLIYGALLCTHRAGVEDIEGCLRRRLIELSSERCGL